jgi:hypothetical protein
MRVGKRGFIETSDGGQGDVVRLGTKSEKWHVVDIGSNLCFFEYSERQLDGIGSPIWRNQGVFALRISLRRNSFGAECRSGHCRLKNANEADG